MILDELAAHARERVAADKAKIPLEDMKAQAEALPQGDFRFEKALSGKNCAFICEVKKASPSKGIIDPVFDFEKIAQSYEQAGADAVLVGEYLMRAADKKQALDALREATK